MEVVKVRSIVAEDVETDDGRSFIRFSATDWMEWMGDLLETCYVDKEEPEMAYQRSRETDSDLGIPPAAR